MVLAGAAVLRSLDEAGGSSSELTWAAFGGNPWFLTSMASLEGCPLLTWQVQFPQSRWSKREQDRSCTVFFTTLEVTYQAFDGLY